MSKWRQLVSTNQFKNQGPLLQVVYRNVSEDSAPAASCLEEHVAKLRLLNTVSGAVR